MKVSKIALLAATVISVPTAYAASPDFNYVEGGYSKIDVDNSDYEPDGFKVSGSALVGKNVFVNGSYTDTSDEINNSDIDFNQLSLGIGYRMAASSNTDVYGVVSYEEAELEDYDENGYGLTAGIRSRVTPNIELDGGVSYLDLDDDDDTYLNLAASYYFTPAAAVSVSYRTSDDNDIMGVSARYSF
ncbi:porin family outer membrane protein [Paraglaciecola mesophila KMM 241]|uniref:Porin family outer membrane protein n=1 Tax=Paraglaciecola mesophila KMM 241 TaxID=1128912 RepID=K6Z819_9ALTE|nr:porin family protein [Paraglaciecola mesophila]GAC25138.1 porin family outer membrane protein [Paraglaciecola mesophila KMM 241]